MVTSACDFEKMIDSVVCTLLRGLHGRQNLSRVKAVLQFVSVMLLQMQEPLVCVLQCSDEGLQHNCMSAHNILHGSCVQ